MKKIDNIASIEGRLLLQEIYHKLKFERQRNSFSVLLTLWRLCTIETDVNQYINKNNEEITIQNKLGILRGTSLWLEEIVNRYYFSKINSLVYFGAAVLLVLIGLNNFSDLVNNHLVIYGLAFEASMLLLMFFIMLFTPNDEGILLNEESEDTKLLHELITDIGEISSDISMNASHLDNVSNKLVSIIDKQNQILTSVVNIAETNILAVKPNPQMLEIMQQTNTSLEQFNNDIKQLNQTVEKLKYEEIELIVRKEVEKFLTNKI
ncbi:MAG: hypothetical protein IJK61_05685 [Bacteroidetes bacterium]|nr:hypothetical protein [Bacteroidota bacterium]